MEDHLFGLGDRYRYLPNMLDFIFRRGNPTNSWQRTPNLTLSASLDAPSLNIALGSRFDRLSCLGRNDTSQLGTLCYFDLGIGVDHADDGTFLGYMIVFRDEDNEFQPPKTKLPYNKPMQPRCDRPVLTLTITRRNRLMVGVIRLV